MLTVVCQAYDERGDEGFGQAVDQETRLSSAACGSLDAFDAKVVFPVPRPGQDLALFHIFF